VWEEMTRRYWNINQVEGNLRHDGSLDERSKIYTTWILQFTQ